MSARAREQITTALNLKLECRLETGRTRLYPDIAVTFAPSAPTLGRCRQLDVRGNPPGARTHAPIPARPPQIAGGRGPESSWHTTTAIRWVRTSPKSGSGHVLPGMVSRYSHVPVEPKRALDEIAARQREAVEDRKRSSPGVATFDYLSTTAVQ